MPPIQSWFTGTAIAAAIAFLGGVVGVTSLGYGWYRAATVEMGTKNNKEKTDQVKRLLGETLAAGNKLIEAQQDTSDDQYEQDATAWVNKAHDLIAAAYGDGEGMLLMDSSGYIFYGDASRKSQVRNWVDGRLRRITELLRRTDTLAVRAEFDPKQFQNR
jgi:hypothetical protein